MWLTYRDITQRAKCGVIPQLYCSVYCAQTTGRLIFAKAFVGLWVWQGPSVVHISSHVTAVTKRVSSIVPSTALPGYSATLPTLPSLPFPSRTKGTVSASAPCNLRWSILAAARQGILTLQIHFARTTQHVQRLLGSARRPRRAANPSGSADLCEARTTRKAKQKVRKACNLVSS